MGRVGGQRNRCASAHDLLLSLDFHCGGGDLELGNSAITGSENEVSVSEQLHAVDTLGE